MQQLIEVSNKIYELKFQADLLRTEESRVKCLSDCILLESELSEIDLEGAGLIIELLVQYIKDIRTKILQTYI